MFTTKSNADYKSTVPFLDFPAENVCFIQVSGQNKTRSTVFSLGINFCFVDVGLPAAEQSLESLSSSGSEMTKRDINKILASMCCKIGCRKSDLTYLCWGWPPASFSHPQSDQKDCVLSHLALLLKPNLRKPNLNHMLTCNIMIVVQLVRFIDVSVAQMWMCMYEPELKDVCNYKSTTDYISNRGGIRSHRIRFCEKRWHFSPDCVLYVCRMNPQGCQFTKFPALLWFLYKKTWVVFHLVIIVK